MLSNDEVTSTVRELFSQCYSPLCCFHNCRCGRYETQKWKWEWNHYKSIRAKTDSNIHRSLNQDRPLLIKPIGGLSLKGIKTKFKLSYILVIYRLLPSHWYLLFKRSFTQTWCKMCSLFLESSFREDWEVYNGLKHIGSRDNV